MSVKRVLIRRGVGTFLTSLDGILSKVSELLSLRNNVWKIGDFSCGGGWGAWVRRIDDKMDQWFDIQDVYLASDRDRLCIYPACFHGP